VDAKSNEIPAVRDLLKAFTDLAGAIITIDALHTQHDTAQVITYAASAAFLSAGVDAASVAALGEPLDSETDGEEPGGKEDDGGDARRQRRLGLRQAVGDRGDA
jgi:hypothetical protein